MPYKKLGLESMSYRIFTVYPDLETACRSVVEFVGMRFPGESGPLAEEMIRDAFTAYREAEPSDKLDSRYEFIQALCARAIYLYRVRYCSGTPNKITAVWLPMVREVTAFERLHDNIIVLNDPDPQQVNAATATRLFAARILPGHLYSEIFSRGKDHATAA